MKEVLTNGQSHTSNYVKRTGDDSEQFTEVIASPINLDSDDPEIIVTLRDVTEKTRLSSELARTVRLKALGEMASGVAHDFNNLLGVILGRAQLLLRMIGVEDAGTRRNVEIIERSAIDGAETVRRIQEFAKVTDTRSFVPVDLNQIIEDSVCVTKPRWKDQIQKKGSFIDVRVVKADIPKVLANPSELREVFLNLINNALDAMPEGGRLSFETGSSERHVYATVKDSGDGIPPGIIKRIFDPFFTTRVALNTGLGLSIVYGIIKRHGGEISVLSRPGDYTTFRIELPIMEGDARMNQMPPVERSYSEPATHKSRILIIDDEEDIRNLLVDMLGSEGHTVEIALSGTDGVAKCKERAYDYVITDLGMPEMSGWEVAKSIKSERPGTVVILATGWGQQFDKEQLKEAGVSKVISKPFQIEEVLRSINGHR